MLYHFSPTSGARGALLGEVLGASDLRGLAEAAIDAVGDELVVHVAHSRAGGEPGRSIRLAAFSRNPQVRDGRLFSLQLRRPLEEALRLVAGLGDRGDVAVSFDTKTNDGLARLGDALDDAVGPLVLDADYDDRCDVRVRPDSDQRPEVQLKVLTELEPAISMGKR